MKRFFRGIPFLLMGLTSAFSAQAQTEQDFINAFSGQWYVFEKSIHSGSEVCSLILSAEAKDGMRAADSSGCTPPFAGADRWSINEGRIILSGPEGDKVVLGGNQFRITGEITDTGRSVVVERAQGDGNSAKIAAALRDYKCYFVGFTQSCAKGSDLQVPTIDSTANFATIEVLATLNARAQPRRDAATLGTIAEGTEVNVDQCLTASDGPWCRAQIGENTVWLAMTALRQDKWPILTFRADEKQP